MTTIIANNSPMPVCLGVALMAAASAKLPSLNRKNRPEPTKNPERPFEDPRGDSRVWCQRRLRPAHHGRPLRPEGKVKPPKVADRSLHGLYYGCNSGRCKRLVARTAGCSH